MYAQRCTHNKAEVRERITSHPHLARFGSCSRHYRAIGPLFQETREIARRICARAGIV
jgi:hypothetical protein